MNLNTILTIVAPVGAGLGIIAYMLRIGGKFLRFCYNFSKAWESVTPTLQSLARDINAIKKLLEVGQTWMRDGDEKFRLNEIAHTDIRKDIGHVVERVNEVAVRVDKLEGER